ncbi:MAG: ferrochelatase [Zoogloeaceae bacterium]|jgi:ferrochelatase|nr:ferrochelatase [Zoogloeaceae bacterium]
MKTGVLLVNLGSPDAPTPTAVRRYLREFLSDPRVVEMPRYLWLPLLHALILPLRARRSAAKYALIWGKNDAPLREHTQHQAQLLQAELAARDIDAQVFFAMRYGKPAIGATLDAMRSAGVTKVMLLPLYPQYAASTTASTVDAVCAWLVRCRNQPEIHSVRSFFAHPGYLAALAQNVRQHWQTHGAPDDGTRLILSFHGLPEKSRVLGDPYYDECQATGHLLARLLQLESEQYYISFQSRFGRAAWLQPYTVPTLQRLAQSGVRRVDLLCPGFTADCLETLEEIALAAKSSFLTAGGGEFHYIPALNASPRWITALADLLFQSAEDRGQKTERSLRSLCAP